jgi:hypothetical protein
VADDYILAARNKLASARRHLAALNKLRAGDESERSQIQDAFEDIISRGFSAGDQLAEAIALKAGLQIRNNSPEKLLKRLEKTSVPSRDEFESCIQRLREWTEEAIVRDARARRNSAVHHHYEKRPYKLQGTWMLDAVTIRGEVSPYQGLLDVHSYCATFVEKLASLEKAAQSLQRAGS